MKPFLDSTDVIYDGPELQHRMQRDGYLFIRGLLPKEVLESLRMQFLEIMREAAGEQQHTACGVANLAFASSRNPSDIYHRQQQLTGLSRLQHHPNLLGAERLLGYAVCRIALLPALCSGAQCVYNASPSRFYPDSGYGRDIYGVDPVTGRPL